MKEKQNIKVENKINSNNNRNNLLDQDLVDIFQVKNHDLNMNDKKNNLNNLNNINANSNN